MANIARFYDAGKNEDNAAFPGVPLRDLTDEEYDALPDWLKASVDASPMYRKSKPQAERPSRARAEADKGEG